jgi:hypothetical protein
VGLAGRTEAGLDGRHVRGKNKRDLRNKVSTYYPTGVQQDSTKRTRVSLGHGVALKDFALFDRLTSKVYLQNAKIDDQTQGRYTSAARRSAPSTPASRTTASA